VGQHQDGRALPAFSAVALSGFADTTFGISGEVGIPVNTVFSKNTELVPGIFNDTKIGNFKSSRSWVTPCSLARGPGRRVAHARIWITLGYSIQRPVPGVEQFIPVFELKGSKDLNKENSGSTALLETPGSVSI